MWKLSFFILKRPLTNLTANEYWDKNSWEKKMQRQVHQPDENEIDLHEKLLNAAEWATTTTKNAHSRPGMSTKRMWEEKREINEPRNRKHQFNLLCFHAQIAPMMFPFAHICTFSFSLPPLARSRSPSLFRPLSLSLYLCLSFGVLFNCIMHIDSCNSMSSFFFRFSHPCLGRLSRQILTSALHIDVKLKPIDLTTMKINRIGFIGCAYFMLLRQIELIAYRCNCTSRIAKPIEFFTLVLMDSL